MVNIEKITVDNYENRIKEEDIDHIIRLLNEYSEKLGKACDSLNSGSDLDSLRETISLAEARRLFTISLLGGLVAVGLDVIRSLNGQQRGLVILTFFILTFLLLYSPSLIKFNRRRTDGRTTQSLTRYTVDSLAERLLEVIGLASPAYEYIETKRMKKIELALKLAEAESTLEYYKETIDNLPPKK